MIVSASLQLLATDLVNVPRFVSSAGIATDVNVTKQATYNLLTFDRTFLSCFSNRDKKGVQKV